MKKKNILILLTSLILLLLLCSGCSEASVESVQRIVQVTAGGLQGSGVIYENNGASLIVVTAAHVLEQEKEKITITFDDNLTVESKACYISANSDIAFVEVALDSIPKSQLQYYQAVQIDKEAFDAVQKDKEVIFCAAGTDHTMLPEAAVQNENKMQKENLSTGIVLENCIFVEDFEQYMMLLQGEISPGMSGGGIFDEENHFLGILCGANEKGQVVAVPLHIIQAEYTEIY